jgi:hypothetical protein
MEASIATAVDTALAKLVSKLSVCHRVYASGLEITKFYLDSQTCPECRHAFSLLLFQLPKFVSF